MFKKRKFVKVSINTVDKKTREYMISSAHCKIIMGFTNPSNDFLKKVIDDYKFDEAKGNVKRLKKIPVIFDID